MASMSPKFAELVAALETKLSQTVAAPHQQWELGSLEQEAESLLMQAQTVAERDAAKSCLTRIDRFVSIQRRYRQVARGISAPAAGNGVTAPGGLPAAPPAGSPLISSRITAEPAMPGQTTVMPGPPPTFVPASPSTFSPSTVAAPGTAPLNNAPFDASGVLKPVVSRREDAPRYALVDESGHVVSFITPSPDVNLQPYVGYRVGVVGRRDYLPNYQRNHVTASRITPLTGRLWR